MLSWQSVSRVVPLSKRELGYAAMIAALLIFLPMLFHRLPLETGGFPEAWNLHLRDPIDDFQSWVIGNRAGHPLFAWFFDPISDAIDFGIRQVEALLLWLPWPVILTGVFLLGQRAGGFRVALLSIAGLSGMGLFGLWVESMQTLALMGVSVIISLLIGVPLGILAARSDKFEAATRPILDAMQTMPAFVYLIPVLLFFGIARVPSVVATVIYALPPAIRLTNLGIRRVSPAAVEAARSFGSTPWQILVKVQLPLALPTLMAGVNQTIMMALGIVVIAALIGAGGLGREVLIALQRLRVGEGLEAGLAIVFMAIVLDRISHGFAQQDVTHPHRRRQGFNLFSNAWHRFGPVQGFERGLALLLNRRYRPSQALAGGAAELAGQEADLSGQRKFAWAIASWLQRHAYLVSSLLLLALLLAINAFVVAFGEFPEHWDINLSRPVDTGVAWMRDNLYQIGDLPIGTGPLSDFLIIYGLNPLRSFLQKWLPWPLLMLGVALLAYLVAGWRQALFAAAGMLFIGLLGMWEHSLTTLSQVIVAVIVTVVIAIPLGILAARSNMFEAFLRPILDTLQTIPPFVFLVPVIMLFNIGSVPGIIASVLYALPPGIRLTNLGIRQVPAATIEAATAFGSTRRQLLFKVQIPLALPAIMLGVNQIVMMVLAMVIIAGLVGGGGLGLEAVTGLAKNQTGRGIEAGLAIVVMAMIMDRMTQVWARKKQVVGRGH
jgi:glycine betaine/proline transport system permease protein